MKLIFENINYKQRTVVLLLAFSVILIIAYHLAIKETLELNRKYKEITLKVLTLENAPQQIAFLEHQLMEIQSMVGQTYDAGVDIQEDLLETITVYCQKNNIDIREVPKVHISEDLNYVLETCNFQVQGRFMPLLKLLNMLESRNGYGRLLSAEFTKEKDLKTKKSRLILSVYIQNIKHKE
jgi:hypothetical protein